jgi:hypothetical protein
MSATKKRFPIYSKLIALYPADYRKQYADQILQTTADMLDDAHSRSERIAVWSRISLDLPLSIGRQQVRSIGGYMQRETPSYIVRNSVIAAFLLLPFITAISANTVDKLLSNTTLYSTWLWKMPALDIWVLILPTAALGLALASYAAFIIRGTNALKSSPLRRALDIKRAWPIALPAVFALGILFLLMFHDSTQCWLQSPSHLIMHLPETWKCTMANTAL